MFPSVVFPLVAQRSGSDGFRLAPVADDCSHHLLHSEDKLRSDGIPIILHTPSDYPNSQTPVQSNISIIPLFPRIPVAAALEYARRGKGKNALLQSAAGGYELQEVLQKN